MTPKSHNNVVELTQRNFESVTSQQGVVLVECWASRCGGCKLFDPVFEKAAEKHPGHTFAKIDTPDQKDLTSSLEILHTPSLMLYREAILLFKQAGSFTEERIEDIISQAESLDMDSVRADIEAARDAETSPPA